MKMLQSILKGCSVLLVVALATAPVLADGNIGYGNYDHIRYRGSAPEIDPGSMVGAITLLSCGLMMITDRFRKK